MAPSSAYGVGGTLPIATALTPGVGGSLMATAIIARSMATRLRTAASLLFPFPDPLVPAPGTRLKTDLSSSSTSSFYPLYRFMF